MDWLAIVAIVIDVIQECRDEGVTEDQIRSRSRDDLRQILVIRRAVRQATGLKGIALRRATQEALQRASQLSGGDIDELVESALTEYEPMTDTIERTDNA